MDRAETLTFAEVRAVDVAEVEKSAETVAGITLSPNRVMLFRNGYKIAKTDPRHSAMTDADKAVNDKRPDLYGFWNPGSDRSGKPSAQLKVPVWQHEGRFPQLLGAVLPLVCTGFFQSLNMDVVESSSKVANLFKLLASLVSSGARRAYTSSE